MSARILRPGLPWPQWPRGPGARASILLSHPVPPSPGRSTKSVTTATYRRRRMEIPDNEQEFKFYTSAENMIVLKSCPWQSTR